MKKILSVLLAALMLLSVFLLPVSAAEENSWDQIIFEEVSELIDFEDYLANDNDSNIYLISLIETGYGENGYEDGNALYFYLYNPSRKKIAQSDLSKIQMAIGWDDAKEKPTSFRKYPITIEGSTMNGLYLRCKVDKVTAKELALVKDGVRKYGITEIELVEDGKYMGEAYEVGYSYEFSGYGENVTCSRKTFFTIELDVHHTSRLLGTSDEDGYYNQLVSVYFSLPYEIEFKYGALYDITYEYAKYRTQPIVLTKDKKLLQALNSAVDDIGSYHPDYPLSLYTMFMSSGGVFNQYYYDYYYGYVEADTPTSIRKKSDHYTQILRIVMEASSLEPGERAITSKDLQDYFQKYTLDRFPYGQSTYIYGFLPELFVDSDGDHMNVYHHTREDLFPASVTVDKTNWLHNLFGFSKIVDENVDIRYIQSLSSANLDDEDFCEKYYIGDSDLPELKKFKEKATFKGETVYLLRFGYSEDYFYQNVYADYEDEDGNSVLRSNAAIVEEDVYLGFDILRLGFSDDGEDITTFGVVSSPINIFPSIDNPKMPDKEDGIDWFRLIVATLALLVVVIAICRLPSLVAAFSQTSANLEKRKYYRSRNRKK